MLVDGLAFSPSLERDYLGGCSDECGRLPLLSRISMSTKSSNFHHFNTSIVGYLVWKPPHVILFFLEIDASSVKAIF